MKLKKRKTFLLKKFFLAALLSDGDVCKYERQSLIKTIAWGCKIISLTASQKTDFAPNNQKHSDQFSNL